MQQPFALEMRHISKSFSAVQVLRDVNLSLGKGKVLALMGENGAGKSTLIKILGGIYRMDDAETGEIWVDGEKVNIRSVEDAKKYGISLIHQEICLAENMTVAENIYMNRERSVVGNCFVNHRQMRKEARVLLDSMQLDFSADTPVYTLSLAQKQMVEICRAISANARILVMDEPTSSLANNEVEQLFEQIEQMKAAGISILYISHRMDEIFRISDQVAVLRNGEMIDCRNTDEVTQDELIQMMVGRELKEIYVQEVLTPGAEVLRVEGLSNAYLKDISFSLYEGEVLGFSGLVGAGRTELARAIFGVDKLSSGNLYIDGKKVHILSSHDAIQNGIALVPEDRKSEGLHLGKSIKYNMTLAILDRFFHLIGFDARKENAIVDEYDHALSVKMASPEQSVGRLSGGNQQKVVLTKWLATKPRILILDEPTRGIDIGTKAEIYHLIYKIAKQGVAVILISSEMEEVINLSTRIAVMYEGSLRIIFSKADTKRIQQTTIMHYAAGGMKNESE